MNSLPVRLFHAFLSGAVLALLGALGILHVGPLLRASPTVANFRGNGASVYVPPIVSNPTDLDRDGDGIPNDWETGNYQNPDDPEDAASDFDFDGLTAKQEYDLSIDSHGQYGNPLGRYQLQTIDLPAGFDSITALNLVESAKNGFSLVSVTGIRTGETVSKRGSRPTNLPPPSGPSCCHHRGIPMCK